MSDEEDGLPVLAILLALPESDLREAVGGPWTAVGGSDHRAAPLDGSHLFIGLEGPSVAILIDPRDLLADVGPAVGEWLDPRTLVWAVGLPSMVLSYEQDPQLNAELATTDADARRGFLEALGAAVRSAEHVKNALLIRCEFCDRLMAPEEAVSETCCFGCAGTRYRIATARD